MPAHLENSAVATGLEKVSFHSSPKVRQCQKKCSNYCTIALISHASKVMLKILQTRLRQYMNWELPGVQAGFRKDRGTRDQIANIHWIIEKAREFQKNICFCFIKYTKAFDCVDHNKLWKFLKVIGIPDHLICLMRNLVCGSRSNSYNQTWKNRLVQNWERSMSRLHNKLWKILQEMEIPDHITCLLRDLYASQEATVRTRYGTTDWFQIGKGLRQGCILSPCLFNLYPEYIMWNAGPDELQAGIKIAGRNINSFRCADDTTLMVESQKELKSILMKMKEESEKAGLKFNIQKSKIMAPNPITPWQINREKTGNSGRFSFPGLQNHCRW